MKLLQPVELSLRARDLRFRLPFKFGDRLSTSTPFIEVRIEDKSGKVGVAAAPMMPKWALRGFEPEEADRRMHQLVAGIRYEAQQCFASLQEPCTPFDIWSGDNGLQQAIDTASRDFRGVRSRLAGVVAAHPIDVALWDLLGKLNGYHPFACLTRGSFETDFKGSVRNGPRSKVPFFHTVGGTDALLPRDVENDPGDGRPVSLLDVMQRKGVRRLKIKLGADAEWNTARIREIDQLVATEFRGERVVYYVDFNECAPSVTFVLRQLDAIMNPAHGADRELLCVEQPFGRDLTWKSEFRVHEIAKRVLTIVDEALVGVSDVAKATAAGYNGLAIKLCRGISLSLEMVAAGRANGMRITVQDLTQCGLGLVASTSMAAWLAGTGKRDEDVVFEQNGPHFIEDWSSGIEGPEFKALREPVDGFIDTSRLHGVGFKLSE